MEKVLKLPPGTSDDAYGGLPVGADDGADDGEFFEDDDGAVLGLLLGTSEDADHLLTLFWSMHPSLYL